MISLEIFSIFNVVFNGLFAISFLLACFTFVAFTSYLFTWKHDQDKVFRFIFSDFINPDDGIKNSLGALGAYISHYFFFNAIGISSFFIPFMLFYTSFKFLLRKYKFPGNFRGFRTKITKNQVFISYLGVGRCLNS